MTKTAGITCRLSLGERLSQLTNTVQKQEVTGEVWPETIRLK
jgi:hypothetical protein